MIQRRRSLARLLQSCCIAAPFVGPFSSTAKAAAAPTDDQVHSKIGEILSRSDFAPRTDDWLRHVLDLLDRFFKWLGTLYDNSPPLFWTLLIGCLLVLALLIWHIVWTVRKAFFGSRGSALDSAAADERRRLSSECRAEATRQAGLGQFTEAIRFLFLALVYRFDESGRVSFQRARTNREYLSIFADQPDLYDKLRVFVDILDMHWYGQQPASLQQYESCEELFTRLTQN